MKIINLTPHNIDLFKDGKKVRVFESAGSWRLREVESVIGDLEGIPFVNVWYVNGEVPPYQEGVYYIVSNVIQWAYPERKDLLIPLDLVRDTSGNIIGCRSLGYANFMDKEM